MAWAKEGDGYWWYTAPGVHSGPYWQPTPDQSPPGDHGGQYTYNWQQAYWQDSSGNPVNTYQQAQAAQPTYYQQQAAAQPAAQPAASTEPARGTTPADQSAKAFLTGYLSQYGLGSLGDWAWQKYLNGEPVEQIMLEMRQTPEYKARFGAMDALAQKGHAISESEYIDLERSYTSLFRQAGLSEGFYDSPDDFAQLIAGEVSPSELGRRLDAYSRLVYEADPSAKAFLKEYYGVDDSGILAYTIDPTKALPILEKQFLAAQESAAAVRSGFGGLTKAEAEELANAGLDPQASRELFTRLGLDKELYQPLPGEQGITPLDRETLLKTLTGYAPAIQAIERVRTSRKAQFEGGGSFATTNKGVVGVAAPQV